MLLRKGWYPDMETEVHSARGKYVSCIKEGKAVRIAWRVTEMIELYSTDPGTPFCAAGGA
jgi:hypothetical protein